MHSAHRPQVNRWHPIRSAACKWAGVTRVETRWKYHPWVSGRRKKVDLMCVQIKLLRSIQRRMNTFCLVRLRCCWAAKWRGQIGNVLLLFFSRGMPTLCCRGKKCDHRKFSETRERATPWLRALYSRWSQTWGWTQVCGSGIKDAGRSWRAGISTGPS